MPKTEPKWFHAIPGYAALALITLKLAGVISWPWVAVLAPLWVPVAIAVGVFILTLLVFSVKEAADALKRRRRRKALARKPVVPQGGASGPHVEEALRSVSEALAEAMRKGRSA